MKHYEILNQLGDGTFGCVVKALDKRTGQLVAIKKMKQKYYSWEECVKLPEVTVMRRIHGHPNIIKMREVVRENNELFFVFEYMDGDLLGVIRKAKQIQCHATAATAPPIPYPKIKGYIFQIFQSLAYLHQRGYFHRDMKPENLLVREDPISASQEIVKLADFGLVKEIRARPPFTDYISTRWYRAPELLLQDRSYSSPVDIWAAGCILAELITTRPLFAGSNEVDQLYKIMNVLGSPNEQVWPEGITLAKKIRYAFPMVKGVGLERVLPPHVPSQALDLMKQMLSYDPKKRPTARQCLQHPYFNVGIDEENFSPSSVAKQLAGTLKKFATSPQSAPSGNVPLPSVFNVRRSPVGATTALPKQGAVGVPPLLSPSQKFCSPAGPTLTSAFMGEKADQLPSVPKPTPTVAPEGFTTGNCSLPKLPVLSSNNAKGGVSSAVTVGGNAGNGDVDLDSLLEEFAGELETLKVVPQQKPRANFSALGEGTKGSVSHNPALGKPPLLVSTSNVSPEGRDDTVETFLNSTRYKKSSLSSMESGGLAHATRGTSLQRQAPLATSPLVLSGGHHAAPPPSKAFLAKHMKRKDSSAS
ncbi:putative protein kinase [Trypanosoma rangeli]|uniref:Protein kinase domain-containing protein n=1 Tax=Trypanosoma rangeli TaxID=5698 RepID=A0A3R7K5U6_TRYRA|nr:putative protein kinase [Trypanosoma rangeli]RNF00434.1 putative protein kinase [Trypanosoma rangeli]|eukprot:RNF00434.1 putative protein kinase [Trypanosoma rangeli]